MNKQKKSKFFSYGVIFCLVLVYILSNSCRPALGSAWYPHSAYGTEQNKIIVKSITIKGQTYYPEANGEDFIGKVNIPSLELIPDDIDVFAVDSKNTKMEVSVTIKSNNGQAQLIEGEFVTVSIKIRERQKPDNWVQKFLFLEQDSSINDGNSEDYNPKDPHGNKKYIITITSTTEEVNPWEYYKYGEPDAYDEGNFSTDKFDGWILNMTSINSSDVASYKFKPGSWAGENPAICSGPQISPGALNTAWNLKYYKYTSRVERWKNENGFDPNLSSEEQEKEKRFVFFKFTGNATGNSLNNSMFCLDKYSKFLFFYSEPSVKKYLFGHYIPSAWRDYAAPAEGVHVQSDIPFYKTDPVGFVKEDGSVVIYDATQSNIANADYGPKQNSSYTEPAERQSHKAGYSPYKNTTIKITKKELSKTENPNYTAAAPVILKQPKDVYAALNSPDELKFEIDIAPVPEGEELSYQWYKADDKTSAGTLIAGAEENAYIVIDKSTETNCYFYCIVKNKNTSNNKIEGIQTDYAKCQITDGEIQVDAAYPVILEAPKDVKVRKGSSASVTLNVQAESLDGGVLSYQWYKALSKNDIGTKVSGAENAEYTFVPETSQTGFVYYYCIVTNTNTQITGNQTAERKSLYAKLEVEESYKINFSVAGAGGTLTVLHRGKAIKSGDYIKKGEKLKFIASCEPIYKIKQWIGVSPISALPEVAELIVISDTNVAIEFERKMQLTITPKIYNVDLQSWSTADTQHFNHQYIDGVHLAHKCNVTVKENGSGAPKTWEQIIAVESNGGNWLKVKEKDFIKCAENKSADNFIDKTYSSFSNLKINFSNYILKANRHDYWWAEWTTWGGGQVYPLQALDDNSSFTLVYNEAEGRWLVDVSKTQINLSDDIPLPSEYHGTKPDPNRRISYKNVTIKYDENFTLSIGEEKDFVITYTVDNHDGTRSKGTIKVIYTISWK